MTKIEVFNKATGEITQVEAGSTLGQIIGVSNMTEEEMSEAIAADIKGLSPAKVSEVLKMIIDTEKPFFNAIDAIRNGDTKRFRLVIEEVGAKAVIENKIEGDVGAISEGAVETVVASTELAPEVNPEAVSQNDDDEFEAQYLTVLQEAHSLIEAEPETTKAKLKSKFGLDQSVVDRLWSDLEKNGVFDDIREAMKQEAEAKAAQEAEEKAAVEAIRDAAKAKTEPAKEEAETPNPEFADNPEEAAKVRGQKAFLRGDGPDDNPFDGGTDDYIEWEKNYNHAKKSMKVLFDEGAAAANDGKALADCPYEVDGVKFKGWKKGFVSVEQVEAPKSTDSHADGKQAALNGGTIEDNPHAAGMTKHRIWNEGFAEGKAELATA